MRPGAPMKLASFLARIRRAGTLLEHFHTLESAARRNGLEYIAYAALREHDRYGAPQYPAPAVMLSYPERWVTRYFERGYERIDPVLLHSIGIGVPYLWRWLARLRPLEPRQARLLEEARAAGLAQGMTVPLIGPAGARALLSYATGDETADIEPHLGRMGLYSALFHLAFVEMAGVVRDSPPPKPLTAMERTCLRWTSEGKTSWEIAVILGISEATVRTHLRRARRKLGASTLAMAVARVLHLGLLDS